MKKDFVSSEVGSFWSGIQTYFRSRFLPAQQPWRLAVATLPSRQVLLIGQQQWGARAALDSCPVLTHGRLATGLHADSTLRHGPSFLSYLLVSSWLRGPV